MFQIYSSNWIFFPKLSGVNYYYYVFLETFRWLATKLHIILHSQLKAKNLIICLFWGGKTSWIISLLRYMVAAGLACILYKYQFDNFRVVFFLSQFYIEFYLFSCPWFSCGVSIEEFNSSTNLNEQDTPLWYLFILKKTYIYIYIYFLDHK